MDGCGKPQPKTKRSLCRDVYKRQHEGGAQFHIGDVLRHVSAYTAMHLFNAAGVPSAGDVGGEGIEMCIRDSAEALPQAAGEGVTRRVLAYTDGLMCVENTFEKGAVGAQMCIRDRRWPSPLQVLWPSRMLCARLILSSPSLS